MSDSTALATRTTVAELVMIYELAVADIRRAYELLHGTEERLNATFSAKEWKTVSLRKRNGRVVEFGDVDDVVEQLQLEVWGYLVDRLELRRFISVARAKQLDSMLEGKSEDKFPEITIENVLGFAQGFRSQIDTMLAEAVEEVFSWLRPPGSEYKRNSELEVPRRVVLSGMVEQRWMGNGFRVSFGDYAQPRITALQNVFSALDGQGAIPKTHYGALYDAIDAAGVSGVGETPYFKFRACKNRNLHIEFLRADLLARFNAMAGGKRLRPGTVAA